MKNLFLVFALTFLAVGCAETDYFKAEDGHIVKDGVPQYYIGTNVWYASALASQDPDRLTRELDALQSLGLKNLRILATDENWEGMDIALKEISKRGMSAVLFLNNAWEWSEDGYRKYLEDAGAGPQPFPKEDGYGAYVEAMSKFAQNKEAVRLYQEHVKRVVSRYKDSKAIFSWQICNEPRPFSSGKEAVDAFVDYVQSTAALIKSIDPNHMVSTGNEGAMGCNDGDNDLFKRLHDCPDIDYCTVHIWPYNWGWVEEETTNSGIEHALMRTRRYLQQSLDIAYELRKPLIVEEFGYPRDGFEYVNSFPTTARDEYYKAIFSEVLHNACTGGRLAGCNFWAWNGFARQTPGHQFWEEGDDLCGDPSQEAQGLNGVYITDSSTIEVIKEYTDSLSSCATVYAPVEHDWLFIDGGDTVLNFNVSSPSACKVNIDLAVIADTTLMYTRDTLKTAGASVSLNKGGAARAAVNLGNMAPGFYRINYIVNGDSMPVSFNIGVRPEEICSPQDKPEDFDAFWDSTLAELEGIPLEPVLTLLPEHSNDIRRIYRVEIPSLGGELMGGYLAEPVKPGKYRTFIDYMGYGAEPYIYDPSGASDCIEFLVSVRDQGIFKPGNERWIDRGLESREGFYYRGAFADVKRAVDFLCSRDNVDQSHLFARGESQGGAFTWISAALDERICAIAPAVPFLSDYPDYAKIVSWPLWEMFETADAQGLDRAQMFETLKYFDIKNFTDRIKCPVYMSFGLQDPTCPPHTNFAGYNMVRSEKKYYCVPTCGHAMWRESGWTKERAEWFDSF